VASKKEPSMQPSPKKSKQEGAAAASTSELSDEAPKSAQLRAGSGSEDDLPTGVQYDASTGLYLCDGSVPPTPQMIQDWHTNSPKLSHEEMMSMYKQMEVEWEEQEQKNAEWEKEVCVLCQLFSFIQCFFLILM